jgi:sugar phosphate isomerase/epimerase
LVSVILSIPLANRSNTCIILCMFNFGISTTITNVRDVFSAIEIIGESSFKFVEIRCEKEHFDYEDKEEIKKVKTLLEKNSLSCVSLHPPVWVDIANKEEWTRVRSLREVEKVILVAKRLNVPKIILHPGKSAGDIKKAIESLAELVGFGYEWDINIILENTFQDDFGSHINEIRVLSDKFNLPVCIDTSHASAKEDILDQMLQLFEDRIEHFHLSDSRKKGRDDHLVPYEGKIMWKPVLNFLEKHGGFAIFEVHHHGRFKIIRKLEKIKKQWENNKICP